MHQLRLSTFLTPLAAGSLMACLGAGAALADTTVSTATTTPLLTSTGGNITVASGGNITVSGQPAITVDSNGNVTVASGGTLTSSAASNGGGILVNAGTTSTISNAGTISVVENYTVDPISGTSTASGPIANTTGRYGILVNGAASGSITNSGTISVKGLNSGAILVNGAYTGSITNTGTIAVKGDGSFGIRTQAVSGDLALGGSIAVVGSGAQAVVANGDIGGALTISGSVAQAGSYTTDSSTTQSLSSAALKQGKAMVEVNGNVANGIAIYSPCSATTVGGVASCTSVGTATTTGSISSLSNNPALQIGGASNITIGAAAKSIAGGTYSLVVDGTVTANAGFSATDAVAVSIGGRGGAVSMPGGIGVAGSISATTVDSTATAVLINAGSTVSSLTNSGAIKSTVSQVGGTAAYGIRDLSGTLTSVVNHGAISASAGVTSAAVDLSANTTGVTYTQSLSAYQQAQQTAEQAASGYNAANALVYTSTTGDIITGSGNDLIDIKSGKVTGTARLGGGADRVALSGDANWSGGLNFGTGSATITMADKAKFTGSLSLGGQPATLTIGGTAAFAGTGITGGSQLAVTVNGGSFGAGSATTLAVNSLTVNSGGAINAYIDSSTGTSSLIQATTASFASGSKVTATISSLANATGTFRILTAGTLTGTPTFSDTAASLPLLFKGSVSTTANDLFLTIARKNATELGLTSASASAYDAIYANAGNNATLASSLLQAGSASALQGQFNRLLPDHAGGVFDFVTRGARLATRHLADDSSLFSVSDVGGWLEPIYFRGSKDTTGTAGWRNSAFGLSGGLERKTDLGYVGLSLAWYSGKVHDESWQDIKANAYQIGAFWRVSKGPLYAFAKLAANRVTANSVRTFTGAVSGSTLTYQTGGNWSGWALTGDAGASYKLALPGNFSLKPMAIMEYANLREKSYQEAGSSVINLAVGKRNSQSLSARTTLTAGWSMGPVTDDNRPLTFELEGGRRNQLSGKLGATTASFSGGNAFTITPDALKSGWLGEARILLGGFDYTWQLAGAAEQTQGKTDYSLRASLSMAF